MLKLISFEHVDQFKTKKLFRNLKNTLFFAKNYFGQGPLKPYNHEHMSILNFDKKVWLGPLSDNVKSFVSFLMTSLTK